MLAYTLLNTIIIIFIIVFVIIIGHHKIPVKKSLAVLFVLFIMTSFFDSVIVKEHIYSYNLFKILGLYIGYAPIEDFGYPIAAVILVPYLWKKYAEKD